MLGEPCQTGRFIQRGMARMQQVARRVIDIHQHRIETAAGGERIDPAGEADIAKKSP